MMMILYQKRTKRNVNISLVVLHQALLHPPIQHQALHQNHLPVVQLLLRKGRQKVQILEVIYHQTRLLLPVKLRKEKQEAEM